jgi:outer membrane lipoprotein carrier protein
MWFAVACGVATFTSAQAHAQPAPALPAAVDAPDPALDALISGVEGFYGKVEGLQIRFSQTVARKFRPGSAAPVARKGTAFFQKPGKMRWDYKTPEPVYYVSDGETLWVYEVEQNTAYKGAVRGTRLFDSMKFLFGNGKLREDYTVRLGVSSDESRELILTPKSGQQTFQSLVLVVNPKSFEIKQTRLVDPAGDESVITFEEVVVGPIKNPEWFSWQPGPGVKVEDLARHGQL